MKSRATIVWFVLAAATVLSVLVGDHSFGIADLASAIVLAIAFVKVRIVGSEFMELRGAPLPMRLVFDVWVIVVCAVLIVLYRI